MVRSSWEIAHANGGSVYGAPELQIVRMGLVDVVFERGLGLYEVGLVDPVALLQTKQIREGDADPYIFAECEQRMGTPHFPSDKGRQGENHSGCNCDQRPPHRPCHRSSKQEDERNGECAYCENWQ